jgi:hypothetical protein
MEMNWDYIAGFFDGEGTISFNFRKSSTCGYGYQARAFFQLSQKDRGILDEINAFIGQTFRVTWTQRAHKLHTQSYEGLQNVCDNLQGRLHVKKRQLELLSEYLDLMRDYHYRSFAKERMFAILRIAKEMSQNSIKPNSAYQKKLGRIREEVERNPWTPEKRYERMSLARKRNWQERHERSTTSLALPFCSQVPLLPMLTGKA